GTTCEIEIRVAPQFLTREWPARVLYLARRSCQPKLKRLFEMLENWEPVPKPRPVAFVNNDKVEEIPVVTLIQLLALELFIQILIVREKDFANQVLSLPYRLLVNYDSFIIGKRRKRPVCLILQAIPIRQEQH